MNDIQHTYLDVIAPTIEEAIAKGLEDLNLPREAVDVEILDKGRRGLLGVVGNRQVRIRLFIKGEEKSKPLQEIPSIEDFSAPLKAEDSYVNDEEKLLDDDLMQMAQDTLINLLDTMQVNADVSASWVEKPIDDGNDDAETGLRRIVTLNITGEDLSILIGRQAETLHALQFITSLMVNKKAGRSVPLTVDVEGYRERRRRQLLQMAHRMAEQAMRSGRRQVLEPMPAEDRRTIHLELRNHANVFTESIGEEPRRKVTIVPK